MFASLFMSSLLLRENVLALIMAQVCVTAAFLFRHLTSGLAGVCAAGSAGSLRGLVVAGVSLGVRLGRCPGAWLVVRGCVRTQA